MPFVERYRERYAAAGHDPAGLAVGACSHVHVARDTQTARKRWEPYHMHYIRWVIEDLLPWGGANLQLGSGLGRVPEFERLVAGPSICGSPAEVVDRISHTRELLGLDVHLAMFDHGAISDAFLDESLELFASEVLPHVAA